MLVQFRKVYAQAGIVFFFQIKDAMKIDATSLRNALLMTPR